MALIVEDGTGVVGANTYVSVAEHIAYALLYGKTVSSDQAEINLRMAMDYIEMQKYRGTKKYTTNTLAFPRDNVCIDGVIVDYMTSFAMIQKAENEIAMSIQAGVDPLAVKPRVVKSETFGPFSKTYADNKPDMAVNPRIMMFLNPLLAYPGAGGFHFKVITHTCHGDY